MMSSGRQRRLRCCGFHSENEAVAEISSLWLQPRFASFFISLQFLSLASSARARRCVNKLWKHAGSVVTKHFLERADCLGSANISIINVWIDDDDDDGEGKREMNFHRKSNNISIYRFLPLRGIGPDRLIKSLISPRPASSSCFIAEKFWWEKFSSPNSSLLITNCCYHLASNRINSYKGKYLWFRVSQFFFANLLDFSSFSAFSLAVPLNSNFSFELFLCSQKSNCYVGCGGGKNQFNRKWWKFNKFFVRVTPKYKSLGRIFTLLDLIPLVGWGRVVFMTSSGR